MKIDSTSVVTDNDFINHLSETKLPEETLIEKLKTIFSELGIVAIVHPLVYDNEVMHSNKRTALLFFKKVIQKVEFSDIFQGDETKKTYYIMLIKEIFKTFKGGKSLPISDEKILTSWLRQISLGEIHSIAMCLICDCNIFLSDDGDSKKLTQIIQDKFPNSIEVYNREELIDKHLLEGKTTIPRNVRRSLSHKIS